MKVLSKKDLQEKLAQSQGHFSKAVATDAAVSSDPYQTTRQLIKNKAMTLLSHREYSRVELLGKLNQLAEAVDSDVAAIVSELQESGLQSDLRYCEMLLRSRVGKRVGPFKIRMELKQKGVAPDLIENTLHSAATDWFALAKQAVEKKGLLQHMSEDRDVLQKNKAKVARFLTARGFSHEHVRYVLEAF